MNLREVVNQENYRHLESCEKCGRKMKAFMHNCPSSSNYEPKFGCPYCDDICGFCGEDNNGN